MSPISVPTIKDCLSDAAACRIIPEVLVTTSVAEYFLQISPTTLQRLEFGVQNNLGAPWLWDTVFVNLLSWPAFAVLAAIGFLLMLIGRRRRRVDIEDLGSET